MPGQPIRPNLAVILVSLVLVTAGCGLSGLTETPDELAFTSEPTTASSPSSTTTTSMVSTTTTTTEPEIKLGSVGSPFIDLPEAARAKAVESPTGVVLPILGERDRTWLVMTACENLEFVPKSAVDTVGRAHVVLDPGHGGSEIGAVGPQGSTEKQLNLAVALEAQRQLSELGATAILTRSFDHNLTTGVRGLLAKTIDPALFVSIHHNGGAPRSGPDPGTIVFTKTDSAESTRFGSLFHQHLGAMVTAAADEKRQQHRNYLTKLDEYEALVSAYDESVKARDAALLANGLITATTNAPSRPEPVDGVQAPSVRSPIPTTTLAPTPPPADGSEAPTPSTVAVPDTLPLPPPFAEVPVREFLFAGGPNGGVRSWTRADGKDYLSLLRHSGSVPAVLAEFLYVTNPSEEELLVDPDFVAAEATALVESIVDYFSTSNQGSGIVADQFDDQPIGGGGLPSGCVEPDLGLPSVESNS